MAVDAIFTEVPLLQTKRFLLRGLTLSDSVELFAFLQAKETMKFITPHPVQKLSDMEEKVQGQLERFAKRKEIPWVIIDKGNESIVGEFHLHKVHLWHMKAEMGVVIKKEYQSKGVMSEIMAEVLAFGFNELGLNRIVGDIFAGNVRSEKILQKFGFTKEGVLRQTDFDGERFHDTVVYSMMRSEYDVLRDEGKKETT